MEIFVDAHVFDGEFQGSRTYIKGLYSALAKMDENINIHMACYNRENFDEDFKQFQNIKYIQYKSNNKYIRLALEIPFIIKKYKFDYAHFQYVCPPVKICKYIVTIHDLLFNDFPEEFPRSYRVSKNILFKYSANNADILTTVSNYSKLRIAHFYKISAVNIKVVPDGVSDIFFQDRSKERDKDHIHSKYGIDKYLLYVSRIEPRKNHDLLLKAYNELNLFQKGYHLVMIGKKTIENREITNMMSNFSQDALDHIHFFEKINNHDLLSFYNCADLFVFPSKGEGFGIPPLEAAALKIPVLVSNSTAMKDFIFLEKFDPYDLEELKEKIITKLSIIKLEQLQEISNEIKSRYIWAQSAKIFYDLIK